ncbi:Teichuronic acid biosynthesis protein TuaB [compost metagenome]
MDNLLVGIFMGNKDLGYYDKGYKLMLYPVQNLTFVITPVMHPILSEHQHNKAHIYNQYIKVVKILSLIGVFITAYCFFTSREIILIMFGNQWENSILCFQILSLSIFFQITVSSAGAIYQSLGNTKTMFKSGIVFTIVMVICILCGVSTGEINKLAIFVTLGLIIKFLTDYYFLIEKTFGFSVIKFYKIFIPDMIILLLLFTVMYIAGTFKLDNIYLSAVFKLSICTITYFVGLLVTKQYLYLFMILPSKMRNKIARR